MLRRLLINVALAFIAFPMIMLLSGYFGRYILHDYSGFSGNFGGFTRVTLKDTIPALSFWMLLGVLLPYNTVVYYYKKVKEKEIQFIFKVLIFLFIEILTLIIVGFLHNLPISIYSILKIFLFFLFVSFIIVSLHDFFLNKKGI